MRADDILQLLSVRHSDDVFIPECMAGYGRMDAWALRKSWSHPLAVGYEIKVNRSDFLNDKKWMNYVKYCNEFYFVCPSHLIGVEEVPENCGLLWTSKTGTRLYAKKKAPYRTVEISERFYRAILFSRIKIIDGRRDSDRKTYWEKWLRERELNREFGRYVSKSIRETVRRQIDDVKAENAKLRQENTSFQDVRDVLKKLGIEYLGQWAIETKIKTAINEYVRGFSDNFIGEGKRLLSNLSGFLKQLEKISE